MLGVSTCFYRDGAVCTQLLSLKSGNLREEMHVMAWLSQMQGIVVFPDLFSLLTILLSY